MHRRHRLPISSGFPTRLLSTRRLVVALGISLLLHLAIASRLRAPQVPVAPQPMQATLIAATEEPTAPPSRVPQAKPRPEPAAKPEPRLRRTPRPVSPREPILREARPEPAAEALAAADVPVEETAGPETGSGENAQLPSAPVNETAPTTEAPAPPVTPLRAERPMPARGTIRYDLFYGANRFLVGRSELTWTLAEGRYRLSTTGKTIGVAALFYPLGVSSGSEGRTTAAGFQPELFQVDRTNRKGEKQFRVAFDWDAGVARFSGTEGSREVPLRPASLDLLSLICQLSVLKLEPGPIQLNLTNGRKLDTYEIEVGPQEVVETPMGNLRAVYVKQLRKPGDEGIEVWLALDFAYLPVRLRFTDRKGSIAGEQLVTDIQLVRG